MLLSSVQYLDRGVARIFQRGGHTVSNITVMAFSPRNIVGCFLKKKAYKGGVTGTPGPPTRYALVGDLALTVAISNNE